MNKILKRVINKLRIMRFSLRFDIGRNCHFGKISFWDCESQSIKIGNNVSILRGNELCAKSINPIVIGNNVFINQRCLLRPNVFIDDNVSIGPNVVFMSDSHEIGDENNRAGQQSFDKIKIGRGVWIGANSLILGNVNIGNGAVIAGGAVVINDCESNYLYAGVPAKKIRKLD